MPSFKTNRKIIVQPYDSNVAYDFKFTQNSARNASDGFLPYGGTMTAAEVSAVTEDGTAVTSLILSSAFDASTNIVTVRLRWPSEGAGRYFLRFKLTIDANVIIEADFGRVFAEDLP